MNVGDRIRNRRLELNLTQDELAAKTGYKSRASINKIELDAQKLTQPKIAIMAKALETTPSYLLGWEDEQEKRYHYDVETAKITQQMHDRPELKTLMNSSRKLSKEAVLETQKFVEFQLAKEEGRK